MIADRKQLLRTILTAVAVGGLGFFVFVFLLKPFFSGSAELSQSLRLGGLNIQYYGLLLGLGALAGYWITMRRRAQYGIPAEHADNIILFSLVAGFIGARLYHVISDYEYYLQQPSQIFAVWNGGLGIFGAAIGAVLAVWVYKKYVLKSKLSFLQLLDWLTPGIVIGQIIGRFGNFINYELYGYPTTLPWKMYVPELFRAPAYEFSQFFHPLFLYEAAGSAVILVLILKLKLRAGRLFLLWLLLYNVMRFFLEFLRVDSVVYSGIRINAIVAAVLALLAAGLWYKLKTPNNNVISSPSNN